MILFVHTTSYPKAMKFIEIQLSTELLIQFKLM